MKSLLKRDICIYVLEVQNKHKNPQQACDIIQLINNKRRSQSLIELNFPTKAICREAQDAANKLIFADKAGFFFNVISDSLEIAFEDIRDEEWLLNEVIIELIGVIFSLSLSLRN